MAKEEIKHSLLTVKDRSRITINGVTNVAGFDQSFVTLDTNEGIISVEGQELKIESLSREGGVIEIIGKIEGVFYSKQKPASQWKRLFG